ncbi:type II toxin-antitoxin system RelB/DinJ family antitoxin [Endozoicomonas euniceicola]|uniref:Type II toxin-antitoxin system RelB/DinJ family antitoxin n=1 Tax=Endozoicomonas euniceicola TaxID=1234143 RepID=A0ABY6GN10_9GAMM|nr:type II toxin-antitoxin system RelB/DinJ family antitoxin [Endozoicomonas euniceicola]UYM14025.1 type II toxin-antitoxin system RelB/DinJ family antitoxin [Endozoicomonas euniceicola]
MSKSAVVRARIEPEIKAHAEAIFRKLGLSTTEAITLFYKQVGLCNGLPFPVRIPNDETAKVLDDIDAGIGLVKCESVEDMFKKLDVR